MAGRKPRSTDGVARDVIAATRVTLPEKKMVRWLKKRWKCTSEAEVVRYAIAQCYQREKGGALLGDAPDPLGPGSPLSQAAVAVLDALYPAETQEQRSRRALESWLVSPSEDPCAGVIIFAQSNEPKASRIAMRADDIAWDRFQLGHTIPFTAQPTAAWKHGMVVGRATTVDEAMALLFPVEG